MRVGARLSVTADSLLAWKMAESAKPSLTAEKVIVAPINLKSDVWKYFGYWSVDGKLVEPTAKVVCKLCKLELAYHSTTSNLRLHLHVYHSTARSEHSMSVLYCKTLMLMIFVSITA